MQDLRLRGFLRQTLAFMAVLLLCVMLSGCNHTNSGGVRYSSSAVGSPEIQNMGASPAAMQSSDKIEVSSASPVSEGQKPLYTSAPEVPEPTSSNPTNRIYTEAPNSSQTGVPLLNETDPVNQGTAGVSQDIGLTEADKALARKIRLGLMHDPAFATLESGVKLSVDNGKVTLQGAVGRQSERASLEDFIQGVGGVKSVDDQLEVKATAQ